MAKKKQKPRSGVSGMINCEIPKGMILGKWDGTRCTRWDPRGVVNWLGRNSLSASALLRNASFFWLESPCLCLGELCQFLEALNTTSDIDKFLLAGIKRMTL